jgi:hypothetical protein
MVGLIIVGDAYNNFEAAAKVRHAGSARATFRSLLLALEFEIQNWEFKPI